MSRRRGSWSWRWLVVLDDMPPLPPFTEVMWGFLTKRRAERNARQYRQQMTDAQVVIRVERNLDRW